MTRIAVIENKKMRKMGIKNENKKMGIKNWEYKKLEYFYLKIENKTIIPAIRASVEML